jgi:D-alanine-D-alanine ligase-like ATP-grasp enzyme
LTLGTPQVPTDCRAASRADRHLSGTTGEEGKPAGFGVNARPGPTETSPAPDRIAHAGFSSDKPVAWMVEDARCDC